MKKYILGSLFTLCLLLSPVFTPPAEAAGLTPVQVSAIISLLQTLGVDQSVINNVQAALGGGALSTGGATLTVNGQSSVTNADPLVSRTWAWSGTPGATYSASGNLSGCDTASQNGPQQNWTPWTDTKATGNATNGSSSVIPGAVKYGCVIVGTYNVTKNGQTTTSTATITFKHADGSANTAIVNPSGSQITSGIPAGNMPAIVSSSGLKITSENLPAGDIPAPSPMPNSSDFGSAYSTTLTYSGGTGTPVWSLVQEDGKLPNLTLNKDTGVISGSLYDLWWNISGTYYFTVKLTVGSDVVTKRLSITMNKPSTVASASQIKILTTTLPPAVVGKPYYATIAISPEVGVSNNTWSAAGQPYNVYGSTFIQKIPGFPEGLVIDGKTGVIRGIPIRIGTTSFYVTVGHTQSQTEGSSDSMYYTIQVANSPEVTRLVSQKLVMTGGNIGVFNNPAVANVYGMVTTANFSDGSLVGQKFIYRRVGQMHNRVRGFEGFYCLKDYSPWSDEGTVPGITVTDLGSKSFPATKVHTYGIEYQINPAGVYEFAAVATAADGSTFTVTPHLFRFTTPGTDEGYSQADWLKLSVEQKQQYTSTCDVDVYEQASSNVAVQTFQEEVQTGWGVAFPSLADAVAAAAAGMGLTPTNPTTPPAQSTQLTCTSGTHPLAGNGVVLSDYSPVVISPSGPARTDWHYGVGSCTWSCSPPMLQDGNSGCKSPAPGSGVTITLTGGTFSGIALTPGTVIGTSGADVPGSPFTTGSNGTTPEFWFPSISVSGWTVVVVPVPGYKISSASGCTPAVGIQTGQTLNRCTGMQNGTSVVINLEPDTTVPHLTTLSPSSGKAGTTVTITASGLLGTNSVYLNGTLVDTESSSGGSTPTWISFVIPSNLPSCPAWDRFCTSGPALTPGTYTVSVQNTNGTSNALSLGVN